MQMNNFFCRFRCGTLVLITGLFTGLNTFAQGGETPDKKNEMIRFSSSMMFQVQLKANQLSMLELSNLLFAVEFPYNIFVTDQNGNEISYYVDGKNNLQMILYAIAPEDGIYNIYVGSGSSYDKKQNWNGGKYRVNDFSAPRMRILNNSDIYDDFDSFVRQLIVNENNSIKNQIRHNSLRFRNYMMALVFSPIWAEYNLNNVNRRNNRERLKSEREGNNLSRIQRSFMVARWYMPPDVLNMPLESIVLPEQREYYWKNAMVHLNNINDALNMTKFDERIARAMENVEQKLLDHNKNIFNWMKNNNRVVTLYPEQFDGESTAELLGAKFNDAIFPQAVIYDVPITLPDDGEYEFLVECNDNFDLQINGKSVVVNNDYSKPLLGKIHLFGGSSSLKKGVNRLELRLVRSGRNELPTIKWRRGGEDDFKLVSRSNSRDVDEITVTGLYDADGEKYPLLKLSDVQIFFIDKYWRKGFFELERVDGDEEFSLKFNEKEYRSEAGKVIIAYEYKNNDFLPGAILLNGDAADKVSKLQFAQFHDKNWQKKADIKNLDVKTLTWQPHFIYSDEQLPFTYEINSGVNLGVEVLVAVSSSDKTGLFDSLDQMKIKLPGRGIASRLGNSVQRSVCKSDVMLKGNALLNGLSVTINGDFGGVALPERKSEFMSLEQILKSDLPIKVKYDSFEINGNALTVVLPRPSISELRRFESFRVVTKPLALRTVCMIGEVAEPEIAGAAAGRYEVIDRYSYVDKGSINPFFDTLPENWRNIYNSNADVLMVVFPGVAERGELPWREHFRGVCSMFNVALQNKGIKDAILLVDDVKENIGEFELREFQRLARDYNINLLFVSSLFNKKK